MNPSVALLSCAATTCWLHLYSEPSPPHGSAAKEEGGTPMLMLGGDHVDDRANAVVDAATDPDDDADEGEEEN